LEKNSASNLGNLQQQNKILKNEISNLSGQSSELEKLGKEKLEESKIQEGELKIYKSKVDSLEKSKKDADSKLRTSKTELDKVKTELEKLKKSKQVQNGIIDQLNEELESLEVVHVEELAGKDIEIDALGTKVFKTDQDAREKDKVSQRQYEELQSNYEQLQSKNKEFESSDGIMKSQLENLQELLKMQGATEDQKVNQVEELIVANRELVKDGEKLQRYCEELQSKNQELESTNEILGSTLENLQVQLKAQGVTEDQKATQVEELIFANGKLTADAEKLQS
jgi:chromosome segregation ATPase